MSKRIKSLLVVFLFLIETASILTAQYNWADPTISMSLQDQLPSTYIKKVIQDEFGFTWIASYTGVSRYDGEQTFTLQDTLLPTQTFQDIVYDDERQFLWIASFAGVFSYNVISGIITKYGGVEDDLTHQVNTIALDQDKLWVGGRHGFGYINLTDFSIVQIDLTKSQAIPNNQTIARIVVEGRDTDNIWLGTNNGLIKYNSSSEEVQDMSPSIDRNIFGVHDLLFDQASASLFLGLRRQKNYDRASKVVQFNIDDEAVKVLISGPSWESRQIKSLNDSLILLSTSSEIISYNTHSQKLDYNFQKSPNTKKNKLEYIDTEGRIWASTESHLHAYLLNSTQGSSSFYNSANPNWIHVASDIYIDKNGQHIHLTEYDGEGLYTLDLHSLEWKLSPLLDGEGNVQKAKFSYADQMEGDAIGVIGHSGFYTLRNGQFEQIDLDLPEGRYLSGSFFDSNEVWSVDKKGVFNYNLNTKKFTDFSDQAYSCKEIPGTTEIYKDRLGNIWIGGLCSNFNYYDQGTSTLAQFTFDIPDYNSYITNFHEYKEDLWVFSHDLVIGLIDTRSPSKGIHTTFDIKSLIQDSTIKFINTVPHMPSDCTDGTVDKYGFVWLISPQGLLRFDPQLLTLELFDEEDGLIVDDPDMRVFVADNMKNLQDGRLVYATRKGVTIFDPKTITKSRSFSHPYIKSIRINDQYLKSDSTATFKKSYALKPKENFIGIDFSAIEYSTEKRPFRFKLNGLDEQWRDPEDRRHVYYTNLEGKAYQFELQIADNSGNWTQESLKLNFDIAMFWYKTIWAKLLAAGILASLLFSFYYYRLQRALQEEKTKSLYEKNVAELKMQTLTAQMNPHFLYNSLNSIQHFIIKNQTKEAVSYLDRFSRLVRLILQNSRSNRIPLSDEIEALNLYLDLESIRFKDKFEYLIDVDQNINTNDIEIPSMLIQPFVENAILHGLNNKKDKGLIQVSIKQKDELLLCKIEDNGIGREEARKMKAKSNKHRKSMGMTITQNRINSINQNLGANADMEIIDLVDSEGIGTGTRVLLTLPI